MDTIQFDSNDKTLIGPAALVLQLPGVVLAPNWTPDLGTNPDGTPYFDNTRKQQAWKYTGGDVDAFRLDGGTDNPRLVEYFVPASTAAVPNIQTNPSKDGKVYPYSPTPLRALEADEKLVVLRVGIYFPEVWVRKGTPVSVPTPSVGSGFTGDDHDRLVRVESMLKSLTGQ